MLTVFCSDTPESDWAYTVDLAAGCGALAFAMLLAGFAGVRFAAIENGDFVPATQCIFHLERSGEAAASEDENAQRFHRICGEEIARRVHRGRPLDARYTPPTSLRS